MNRILIVEDEPVIALGLKDSLEAEGHSATIAVDGVDGELQAREGFFDLILLDIMLPGRDGFSVCRNLRASGFTAPVILLTARGQEVDKIKGLDLGADDYITKPFARGELLARIRAALRRTSNGVPEPLAAYVFNGIRIDFQKHQALREGRSLDLTPTEFKMLRAFIENRGRVLPHDEIIERVWGRDAFLSDRVLYTHVNNLRGKVETTPAQPRYLIGVRGIGYRFDE